VQKQFYDTQKVGELHSNLFLKDAIKAELALVSAKCDSV